MRTCRTIFLIAGCAVWAGRCALGAEGKPTAPPPNREGIEFFEKKIRPVLVENCYKCHSATSKKLRGDLRLDSPASMFKARDPEPVVVPRQPEKSLLVRAIRYTDRDLQMPPSAKLDEPVIADFVEWINKGAPVPEDIVANDKVQAAVIDWVEAKKFWSFQPPKEPVVPAVKHADWPRTPIDRFVLAKLEEKNLSPAPPADRHTLIRRATFDLIGLPPTLSEINAFLADGSPDAFAKVIDRLLASPRYGEHWGRHWLDLIHYADTAGDASDYPVPQSYLYRNYVIDAFSRDMPYDRFMREQLVGDLLPAENQTRKNELTVATGFLAMMRRFAVSPQRNMHLTIEDTIDTLGKTVLGLSVSCARCHDHKYDPIPTQDYYSLYGIFDSTRYPFAGAELARRQRDLVDLMSPQEVDALTKPFQPQLGPILAELAELDAERQETGKFARKGKPDAAGEPRRRTVEDISKDMRVAEKKRDAILAKMPRIPRAFAVAEGTPHNARIQRRGEPTQTGDEVQRGFLQILGGQKLPQEVKTSGRLQLADWLMDAKNPLTARVIVNRIWQFHFGKGIVQSPSDFGKRGRAPTHPELLDYLALRFVEKGWSFKAMHRAIMLSQTYQASCVSDPHAAQVDANNDYLSHFGRRRLSAEEIRDAILCVAGTLDLAVPGPQPFPPESAWDFTQHHAFSAVYDTNHRSVYVMQQRIKKHPFFALFDGADTNSTTPERMVSITPLQALYLMNNPFLYEQADHFVSNFSEVQPTIRERINFAHLFALGRPATTDEIRTAEQYLQQYQDKLRSTTQPADQFARSAMTSYARVLLASNEFMFVD